MSKIEHRRIYVRVLTKYSFLDFNGNRENSPDAICFISTTPILDSNAFKKKWPKWVDVQYGVFCYVELGQKVHIFSASNLICPNSYEIKLSIIRTCPETLFDVKPTDTSYGGGVYSFMELASKCLVDGGIYQLNIDEKLYPVLPSSPFPTTKLVMLQ